VHDKAVAFARHVSRSRSDGDDLYQEAVLRALAKLDTLRDDALFRPWLFRVVISVHRNRCRRAFWRRFVPFGDGTAGDGSVDERDYRSHDWTPAAAHAATRARAALATLPADQREAIALFEIEGWTVDEIAALYEVSASAIKSRLSRGRAAMRAHYEAASNGTPALGARVRGQSP
jgi:RNA polymerase sigma-70 factor (ECF subfamily)